MHTAQTRDDAGAGSVSRRFYSERDIATILGVSVKTIQGWRFRGGGPPWKKFAGTVRYSIDEFSTWESACEGGGERAR